MQKLIRAIASAWAWRGNRSRAAIDLPNGVRDRPKCAAHGGGLAGPPPHPGRSGGPARRRRASKSWATFDRIINALKDEDSAPETETAADAS